MSEIQAYWLSSCGDMDLDPAPDSDSWCNYEAAQSELAALREELAGYKHDIASFLETTAKVCNLLGIDTEDAKNAGGKPSDVLFSHAEALRQRLTATEQRNVELLKLLRSASIDYASCLESGYDRITMLGGDCDSVSKMLADNPNYTRYCAALKPTESGASE